MRKAAVVPVPATDAATLATKLEAANDRAEALEQRNAILEARNELQDDSMAQLPIYLTAFAIILTFITVLTSVVMFVLTNRAANEAKAEARNVARDAIDATRKELTDLHDAVVAAQAQAQEKIEEVGRLAERVKEMERETQASLGRTRVHEESAARHANKLFDKGSATGSKPEERSKSPEVAEALKAAELESRKTAQDEWSPEQYQSAINKALWLDEDISRAESLANAMMVRFADDPAASAFALGALGDVALKRKDWATALADLEEAYRLLDSIGEGETYEALRFRYHKGYILGELGRVSEAEAVHRELVPLLERVEGPEAPGTLASRHELARSLLDQGYAEESEAMLRELIPLSERINGAKAKGTLTTRHILASAVLDQGRASEAEAMYHELLPLHENVDGLETTGTLIIRYMLADAALDNGNIALAVETLKRVPDQSTKSDWLQRHAARLAFVRGKLCDAQGESDMAVHHLSEAHEIYAQFPPEYAPRAKFEAYLAARGGLN